MDIMQDVDLANHVPKRRSLRETEDVPTTVLGLSWSVWLRQMLSQTTTASGLIGRIGGAAAGSVAFVLTRR